MSPTLPTRFEVIDESGRVLTRYGVEVELSYQDEGRTLKVFLKQRGENRHPARATMRCPVTRELCTCPDVTYCMHPAPDTE